MPTVQVEAQLSVKELLHAVKQLSLAELEKFVRQVIYLQAARKAPGLSKEESRLILEINQGIPDETQERYDELIARRQAENLTSEEHRELLELTETIESLDAKRVTCLSELAVIRQTSLTELMEDLNIQPPSNG